jgi:NAD(P)-dependent dehydrogenase (short-subunit alcohol dehydrogenase family)
MDLNLAGRRALVTGGSKGIGLAVARQLAAEGCDLVLVARDAERLAAARDDVTSRTPGVGVATEALDLSRDDAAAELAARHAGSVDILVNNAGAIPGGDITQVDQARWRAAWDLKVFGYIGMTRAFYAAMAERGRGGGGGVIVNVIGSAGERLDAGYIAGSTANAGLMALTRALGAAGPAKGVRVVGINPGPVATERLEFLQRKRAETMLGDAERWPELVRAMPFGRAAAPEEIAAAVAFLASDRSAYTSGTILTIDGGLTHRH